MRTSAGSLLRQVTAPVRFLEAMNAAAEDIDLWIEAGPGRVLSRAGRRAGSGAGRRDRGGRRVAPRAAPRRRGGLRPAGPRSGRPSCSMADSRRPFPTPWRPRFFANPCELAPVARMTSQPGVWSAGRLRPIRRRDVGIRRTGLSRAAGPESAGAGDSESRAAHRAVAGAERAELPPSSVGDDSRLLGDLHLNSITVSQIVVEIAGRLGARHPGRADVLR